MSKVGQPAAQARVPGPPPAPQDGAQDGAQHGAQNGAPIGSQSRPSPRRGWVLAAAMLAMFMVAVEGTIVGTAMPTIVADLGGFTLYSWVFSIFLLTQAVTIPLYGKLADMLGRKPVFYLGASLFLGGSLLAGFSANMIQLIAFRALQGFGGGAVMPIALTVVGDIYTPVERAKIQGYLSSVWGISSIFGPALGAFLVQTGHWPMVFWINLPIGIASIALFAGFHRETVPHTPHKVDYTGAALMMAGTAAVMLALIQGYALSGAMLLALAALAVACLGIFYSRERHAVEPLMPLGLWRRRIVATGNSGSLAAGACMAGVISFLPAYVQGVMGRSPAVAGFVLAAMSVGWPVASTLAGRLMVRTSYRFTSLLGAAGLIAGSVALFVLRPELGPLPAALGALLMGVGMGFTTTTYLVAIQTSVIWSERGVATSSNLFARMLGQALGAALLGAVLNLGMADVTSGTADVNRMMQPDGRAGLDPAVLQVLTRAMAAALHNVFAIGGVLAMLTLALALTVPRGQRPGA